MFEYDGADGLFRTLRISLPLATGSTRKGGADLKLSLAPDESKQIRVSLVIFRIETEKTQPATKGNLRPDA